MTRLTKAQWWRQRQLKTFKEHPQRGILKLATFKTLFTFQTIENNNLNVNSDPSMKSEVGQHSQFMQYFKINHRQHQYRDLDILVVTLPSSWLLFIHTVDLSLKLSLSLPMSLSLPLSLSFFQSNHRHYRYLDLDIVIGTFPSSRLLSIVIVFAYVFVFFSFLFQSNHQHHQYRDLDIVVGTLPNSRLLFIKIPPDQPTSLSSFSWWWWWWWLGWWWYDDHDDVNDYY